ncbi:MAG: molybdopterin-dependent oxidoreductase, partial [Chloroflexi bacterium]|nr:molybdopterin-dependent oxidoreductase [Chloroflexota bacterium]
MRLFSKKTELPADVQKRVPPGQYLTEKWPVLHYGPIPPFDPKRWDFRVWGEVASEIRLTWDEFQKLEQATVQADMHCVTTWSKLDQKWEGIPFRKIVELAKPKPSA